MRDLRVGRRWRTVIGLIAVTVAMRAHAGRLRVPQDHTTLAAAFAAAVSGDTVWVGPATYHEWGLGFGGKDLVVLSTDGPYATIVSGDGHGPVFDFRNGERPAARLEGFTVRDGNGGFFQGGGIQILNCSPTIRGNIVTADTGHTGGIHTEGSSSLIENCIVTANMGYFRAGGISTYNAGSPVIRYCTISDNIGQGVSLEFLTTTLVVGNTIVRNSNTGGHGGGISATFGSGTIRGNLIADNVAGDSPGVYVNATSAVIQDNIIRGNTTHNGLRGGKGGGIAVFGRCAPVIVQNLITANPSQSGGGVYWNLVAGVGPIRLVNNTIVANPGVNGAALFADGADRDAVIVNNILMALPGQNAVWVGDFNDPFVPVFDHNDIYSQGGALTGGLAGPIVGTLGNFSADPLFIPLPAGGFRLSPSSPCVNAGRSHPDVPPSDLDGTPRHLSPVDVGWDEVDFPTATQADLIESSASADHVRLVWRVQVEEGSFVTIYRRQGAEDWRALQQASVEAHGMIVLEDHEVVPETEYRYVLGIRSGASEQRLGETAVSVPRFESLSLSGLNPNPASSDGIVVCSSASGAPARLTLFDAQGRRVGARTLVGAGEHRIRLSEFTALREGIFFMQLEQAGRTVSRRGIFVR